MGERLPPVDERAGIRSGQNFFSGGEGQSVNPLSLFGLFAVTSMVVCYALESRSPWFILGFALACALGSVYGFLQGAWPFGLAEAIWCGVAARRWWRAETG